MTEHDAAPPSGTSMSTLTRGTAGRPSVEPGEPAAAPQPTGRAARREAARAERREARRQRQRSRRHVRLRRLAVGGVAAGLVLGAGGAWVLYGSPFFDIRQVQVVGAPGYLADPIQQAAGVTLGGPLVSVDLSVVEERVSQLIDVQRVHAEQQWPHTVVIEVTPRTTVGIVPAGTGGAELVGSDGATMGTLEAAPPGLPLVKGTGDDRRRVAGALASLDQEALAAVEWGQVRDGDVELLLRDGRGFVLWGGDEQNATKGKALAVLLKFDTEATWFDLTRAGTPVTLLKPPPGARLPEPSASTPAPTPGAMPGVVDSAENPDVSTPSESDQLPSTGGGEQPSGLVPQTG